MRLQVSWMSFSRHLILAYQSFGVVYGDLSTSPLYVYKSTFIGKLEKHQNPDAIFGAFSLIFWTLTLIPLLKYVLIVLSAADNGEGLLTLTLLNYLSTFFRNLNSDRYHFVPYQVELLLFTLCYADMQNLVYFQTNKQPMRSCLLTKVASIRRLHHLRDLLKSIGSCV